MAGSGQVVTVTASGAGVDVADWAEVNIPAASPGNKGGTPQLLHVEAGANASSGTATVYFAFYDVDAGEVTHYEPVLLTATSRRKGLDGASGDYDCTVASTELSNRRVDLLAHQGSNVKLYVGAIASGDFSDLTSVTLRLKWTSQV